MNKLKPPSLRWRLFLMLSASTLIVWLGVSWFVHARLSHEVDEIYDAQLQQSSRILAGIIRAGANRTGLSELHAAMPRAQFDGIPQTHSVVDQHVLQTGQYERIIGFQIVDRSGTLLFRSPGAPASAFDIHEDSGFSDAEIDGVRWRIRSFRDDASDQVVHFGEQYAVRQEISRYLLRSMAIPVLVGVAAIGALIWLSLDWGLRPLSELARQVHNREPDDLSAVTMESASTEIRPIVNALNELFARVRDAFDNERRFTGDAAHELRTPLAGLKVQAQVALRAQDDTERRTALSGIIAGVDRTAHLVAQLLDLSRLDWQQRPTPNEIVLVTAITQRVASQLHDCTSNKGVTVTGSGDPDAAILADEALVSMLVCNLLDNAIRYSGAGGRVCWSVIRQKRHVLLEVTDTGPGIPADQRESVFERFHRLPNGHASGAGLGLSIVRKIADVYGAEIVLADPESGHGLRVQARFPWAAADDANDSCKNG